nr:hypothetical protein GCM10020093_098970 [Planobispora longispora]
MAGKSYAAGAVVRYTNGKYYRAEHANPGYDPTISTWYWKPYACGSATPAPTPTPTSNPTTPAPGGFVVSEAQFNQMFPNRNSFYTYKGLTAALSAYPAFAKTGTDTTRRQEAAAFLANVNHETGGLVHIVEQNTANYPHYCDTSQSYGCPAARPPTTAAARSSSAGTSTTRPPATRSASTCCATPTWCRTTPRWPGRPHSGTGTPRGARAP